jgi:predicted phosphodiesterase
VSRKIIFLGDAHLSDRQIKTRADATAETCLEKFAWVLDYAKKEGADIIHTGDFVPCLIYNTRFRYDLKVLLKAARDGGVGFWSVSGNHDVSGADFSELPHREFGQLCMDGYVDFLGPWGKPGGTAGDYVPGQEGGNIRDYCMPDALGVIRGYSAYSCLDQVTGREAVTGLVCHHWIGDAFGDSLVVYPDDLKRAFPNLRFVVSGHDHAFHPAYVSRDGVLVVRPGSMMRTDSGKSSDRVPRFAVWDMDSGFGEGAWSYQEIGCARPYSEVFYTEMKAVNKESAGVLEDFVKRMSQNVDVVMDVNSVIKSQYDLLQEPDKPFVREDLVANGFMV